MKKEFIVALFLVCVIVIAGCVAQPYSAKNKTQKEIDLVKELEEIEKKLNATEQGNGSTAPAEEDNENDAVSPTEANESDSEETAAPDDSDDSETVDTSKLQRIEIEETGLVNLRVDTEDSDKDNVSYTFSPPLNTQGKWQTNYADAGEYVITVVAKDGTNSVEQKILLIVKKKNVPPTIENVPARLTAKEGDTLTLEPKVADPNKDKVTVTYTKPFDADGVWITDHKSAGEYEVVVTAGDGEAESKTKVLVTVSNVNVPPELTGLDDEVSIKEGETATLKPQVSDVDGENVAVSISDPVGDDGVWQTSYTDHGVYTITVTASDGKDTVSKEVKLIVEDVNVPPRIVAIRQG